MRSRWHLAIIGVLSMALSMLTGCIPTVGGERGPNTLTLAFPAAPASLDFTKTDGAAIPSVLLVNVYEGLVRLDETGKIVPLLATHWTISDDRRTYTFALHEGVRFSNGEPFTADSVKFSIERVQRDWSISVKSAMNVVEAVEALSPTSVRVTLRRPSNQWLFAMATRIGAMMTPGGVGDLANNPVGTGPYMLARWTRGDSIELRRRADYWGARPAMETVLYRYYPDPNAGISAVLSGGVDALVNMQEPDALPRFDNDPRFRVIDGTSNGVVTLSMNNASGPMRDLRLRQAVRYALDRRAIINAAWGGRGTLIGGPVPPTDPWYQDLTSMYPRNVDKARELVEQAGARGTTVRLRLPNLAYAVAAGQVVRSQLAAIGLNLEIDVLEFPARWLDVVFAKHDYDMSIINHVEPRNAVNYANPSYYFGFADQRVTNLMATADAGTPQQQVDDMRAAIRLVSEDAAADWLFAFPYLVVADSSIRGLPPNDVSEAYDVTKVTRGGRSGQR